jgi:hypothetical protein
VTDRERYARAMVGRGMTFDTWRAELRRLLGERAGELSETLTVLLYEGGESPAGAARWARIALTGDCGD